MPRREYRSIRRRAFSTVARVSNESRASTSVDTRPLDQFDDARAESDQNVVELPAGVLAGRIADGRLDQWSVRRLLGSLQDQRWIGRRIARPQAFDRRQVAGVGDDRRVALQAFKQRHRRKSVTAGLQDIIRKFICSPFAVALGLSGFSPAYRRPDAGTTSRDRPPNKELVCPP